MKILVFGAGIVGSLYSGRLFEAKYDVTLLARGDRYDNLKTNGLILKNCISGGKLRLNVPMISYLKENDFYDLIIVTVRLEQLEEVILELKKNKTSKNVMFMMNIPDNTFITKKLDSKNVIFGFPGVGGTYRNNLIEYIELKQQKTTIGTTDGADSFLINDIKKSFEAANFKVAICNDMQSWMKTHAVFISSISAAIFKEHGNPLQLAKNRRRVKQMVKSIKEGFSILKTLDIKILPSNLNILFMKMPRWFAIWYWQKALRGETGTLAFAPLSNAATTEMKLIAITVLNITHASPLAAPTLNKLLQSFLKEKNESH